MQSDEKKENLKLIKLLLLYKSLIILLKVIKSKEFISKFKVK